VRARALRIKRGMNLLFLKEAIKNKTDENNSKSPNEPGIGCEAANTLGMATAINALAKRPAASFLNSILEIRNTTKTEREAAIGIIAVKDQITSIPVSK
jgi:hypothetical protein